MSIQNAYADKMNAQIRKAEAEVDRLKAKADEADADARLTYHKHIAEIQEHRDYLQARVDELNAASSEAWEDVKAGAESAWNTLRDSVDRASSRF
ncbi:coiled coil domain-containing protein [Rhodospirillaceae bacterium KN72]|uniref:Coiled coil domain-containing protein n=1 Tax=Pacificispira spongiicola TaxID=2729598 RepID=A0A7Y0HCL1_9PROT|nr:coiled coil domain-containing protein [Pacificispira spongiicola]NMM42846.1 coiled coil domain-containing protein [Pacificispira spongiicola]